MQRQGIWEREGGKGGREGYSYNLWWSAERLRGCMHDGGVHCVSRVVVRDASLCPKYVVDARCLSQYNTSHRFMCLPAQSHIIRL